MLVCQVALTQYSRARSSASPCLLFLSCPRSQRLPVRRSLSRRIIKPFVEDGAPMRRRRGVSALNVPKQAGWYADCQIKRLEEARETGHKGGRDGQVKWPLYSDVRQYFISNESWTDLAITTVNPKLRTYRAGKMCYGHS